ncbi:MAG: o-succinylbenzoate synthase [Salinibacter sp.]
MVLSTVALYRYELPLTAPLRLDGESLQSRHGLLLRLDTAEGRVGWGEAAPLPGFSAESLDDVVAHARSVAPKWTGTGLPDGPKALERAPEILAGADGPASFRFATESALVGLLAGATDKTLPDVLGTPQNTVALNALITSPEEDGPEQAARYRKRGYRAVKVKVGRRPVDREVETLREIRAALGDKVALRADANRAWSLEEAVAFAKDTQDLPLAYVEEPLSDPEELSEFGGRVECPVALDETTRETGPEILREHPTVSAVVLKPTLLGGVQATRRWSRGAQEAGVTPVLSAAYESGVGLRMLLALAAIGPKVPVGLSPYDRLAADVLQVPLQLSGPTVPVSPNVPSTVTVDEERLALVDSFSS